MDKIKKALYSLLEKYDVIFDPSVNLLPGWSFLKKKMDVNDVPLLTWRSNRKFVELHKIVSGNIVEHICMLRFCCLTDSNTDFVSLMYREFDLCEFIGQGKIYSLHATLTDERGGNIILKLDNGVICSVEIGNQIPFDCKKIDRHEIIARRGVASDLVVDTQIPQQSIYMYTEKEATAYKDVDNELFGFGEEEIELIRSSFEFYRNMQLKEFYCRQHNHLSKIIDMAFISNKEHRKININ